MNFSHRSALDYWKSLGSLRIQTLKTQLHSVLGQAGSVWPYAITQAYGRHRTLKYSSYSYSYRSCWPAPSALSHRGLYYPRLGRKKSNPGLRSYFLDISTAENNLHAWYLLVIRDTLVPPSSPTPHFRGLIKLPIGKQNLQHSILRDIIYHQLSYGGQDKVGTGSSGLMISSWVCINGRTRRTPLTNSY